MNQTDPQFDDPALKEAVRRACAGESSPPGLRDRVSLAMMHAAPARRAVWRIGPANWKTWAAAAVALLAVGYASLMLKREFYPSMPSVPVVRMDLPPMFAASMIRTHDACSALADHHLLAGTDLDQLKTKMSADLGISVAVVSPGSGWEFKGAGECTVFGKPAAHLLFARGDQTLSIFSIPANAIYKAPEGATYEQTIDKHTLSGFVSGGGLYCVVGSGPNPPAMSEVNQVRESLHACLPAQGCGTMPASAPIKS